MNSERRDSSALTIFREEALQAAFDGFGRPMELTQPHGWWMASFFVLTLLMLLGFLAAGSYTRKETVTGVIALSSGTPTVVSKRPGTVESVLVPDGKHVKKGDMLFVVSTEETSSEGAVLGREVEDLRTAQSEAKLRELKAELAKTEDELLQTRRQADGLREQVEVRRANVELQRSRLALAEKSLDDIEPLYKKQNISVFDHRKYEVSVIDARQAMASAQSDLEESRVALQRTISQARGAEEGARSIQAQISAQIAQADEQQIAVRKDRGFALVAPADGTMTTSAVKVGDSVVAGAPLAVIVPDDASLIAELHVPSRAIGFVKVGNAVNLMFDAFPYERFGFGKGHVLDVSATPLANALLGAEPGKEPVYRVRVRLDATDVRAYGQRWALACGMTLSADIVLERRTFMQWLLDPIRAASLRA